MSNSTEPDGKMTLGILKENLAHVNSRKPHNSVVEMMVLVLGMGKLRHREA